MPATFAARTCNAGTRACSLSKYAATSREMQVALNLDRGRSILKPISTAIPRTLTRLSTYLSFFFLLLPAHMFAQVYGSGNHQVTVVVSPLSLIQVSGGAVNFNVTTANVVAGQDEMSVSNSASQLLWGTNSGTQKITAQTSLGSPLFTLKLLAVSPTQGTAASEFALSTTPTDFLLNIGRSSGTCTLQYTAVALASQGTGTDNHTITFTIQAQ